MGDVRGGRRRRLYRRGVQRHRRRRRHGRRVRPAGDRAGRRPTRTTSRNRGGRAGERPRRRAEPADRDGLGQVERPRRTGVDAER
ncbi:hypothetical protein DU504_00830 [Haloplanus salinus]|uniref:Uncharacterized protein n=1 Tax=Haloplanus salinus TaxID=1126245 RepID=A0A368N8V4_9EURY|nr:hypothetical protein DU504_00830 [Haloplanus salinus]